MINISSLVGRRTVLPLVLFHSLVTQKHAILPLLQVWVNFDLKQPPHLELSLTLHLFILPHVQLQVTIKPNWCPILCKDISIMHVLRNALNHQWPLILQLTKKKNCTSTIDIHPPKLQLCYPYLTIWAISISCNDSSQWYTYNVSCAVIMPNFNFTYRQITNVCVTLWNAIGMPFMNTLLPESLLWSMDSLRNLTQIYHAPWTCG